MWEVGAVNLTCTATRLDHGACTVPSTTLVQLFIRLKSGGHSTALVSTDVICQYKMLVTHIHLMTVEAILMGHMDTIIMHRCLHH